jgi:hypothetical protein
MFLMSRAYGTHLFVASAGTGLKSGVSKMTVPTALH